MADANAEEEFLFKGEKLNCKKELLGQGCFTYAGYLNEKDISFDDHQGIGGRTTKGKKEAVIRRIRQADCLDGRTSYVSKFMESSVKCFDLKIVMQIFAYEDDKDGWR